VLACFEKRPAALKRLFFAPELAGQLGEVCRWFAREKRAYSYCDSGELARAAGHSFHNGIVAYTDRPEPSAPKPSDYEAWSAAGEALLFVEEVTDPVQIGVIARVAVAMGLSRLILGGSTTVDAAYKGRAWSTAGGALDSLTLHEAGVPVPVLLRALRERFCFVGFTRPGGRRVDELKPIRAPGRPLGIVIGDADTGISAGAAAKCEHLLHIPGANGSRLYTAADTAAYGLPWLLRRARKPEEGQGFLAKKRERRAKKKGGSDASVS
jgi:TrmH RNA methyltransferase